MRMGDVCRYQLTVMRGLRMACAAPVGGGVGVRWGIGMPVGRQAASGPACGCGQLARACACRQHQDQAPSCPAPAHHDGGDEEGLVADLGGQDDEEGLRDGRGVWGGGRLGAGGGQQHAGQWVLLGVRARAVYVPECVHASSELRREARACMRVHECVRTGTFRNAADPMFRPAKGSIAPPSPAPPACRGADLGAGH